MNVFEFAMKMEEDGRAFYLENAEKTSDPALKKVLMQLADDELKHYNLFKALASRQAAEYKDDEKTTILLTVKNVFEEMKSAGQELTFSDEASKVWEEAREVEKKAEAFYREKAAEVSDDNEKSILNKIADEEHRHWVTMDNVIEFLKRPTQYLEDAEWGSLEDY